MDNERRELRKKLRRMPPKKAIEYVYGFDLPGQEAYCIIECDVKKRSCVEVGNALYLSTETVWRRRYDGYAKMV